MGRRRLLALMPLVLMVACSGTTDTAGDAADGGEARASTATSPTPVRTGGTAEVSQEEAEELIRDLRHFAQEPSASRAQHLPFASTVQLGLGKTLVKTVEAGALADAAAWSVPTTQDYAWIADPSSSALVRLAEDAAHTTWVGPHPHCASPPRPAPPGMADHDRVSTQPAAIDSCLSWYSVDLFLRNGEIHAVTLDLWEP